MMMMMLFVLGETTHRIVFLYSWEKIIKMKLRKLEILEGYEYFIRLSSLFLFDVKILYRLSVTKESVKEI